MPRDRSSLPKHFSQLPKADGPFPDGLVAYIDILGWTELTRSGADTAILAAQTLLEKADSDIAQSLLPRDGAIRRATFSDTIVLSVASTREVAALVAQVQITSMVLLNMGLYVRGAVAFGPLSHSANTVAGRALVEAYRLEREVAKYPRIVVTDTAAPLLKARWHRKQKEPEPQTWIDADGLACLELFPVEEHGRRMPSIQTAATTIRTSVQIDWDEANDAGEGGDAVGTLNRRAKYGWMLRYLDRVIADPTVRQSGQEPAGA